MSAPPGDAASGDPVPQDAAEQVNDADDAETPAKVLIESSPPYCHSVLRAQIVFCQKVQVRGFGNNKHPQYFMLRASIPIYAINEYNFGLGRDRDNLPQAVRDALPEDWDSKGLAVISVTCNFIHFIVRSKYREDQRTFRQIHTGWIRDRALDPSYLWIHESPVKHQLGLGNLLSPIHQPGFTIPGLVFDGVVEIVITRPPDPRWKGAKEIQPRVNTVIPTHISKKPYKYTPAETIQDPQAHLSSVLVTRDRKSPFNGKQLVRNILVPNWQDFIRHMSDSQKATFESLEIDHGLVVINGLVASGKPNAAVMVSVCAIHNPNADHCVLRTSSSVDAIAEEFE
ncbi:hypothetical protein DSL72_008103 [Monilinia vaccinii-corymbosi]|uniref:Uncharacterized protein n=1 Tax=Monilinia vaccinii-corymbosi TaxID=61207 RepID=A0A8A3PJT0_9HELO|nr:hypothetical protein DSL72_008103 [Monilinia vaccinii-corymbosi]